MAWRKKKADGGADRYYFATDIHGSDVCFRKFLAAAEVYQAKILILGGDIAGKGIVPIVEQAGGRFAHSFQGEAGMVASDELEDLQARINFNGLYPYLCAPDEVERIADETAYRESIFSQLILDQVRSWCALVSERLDDDVRCVITPGNDDIHAIDAVLTAAERVESPELAVLELGPVWLASLGNTNHTPWATEREFDEEELTRQIDGMLEPVADGRPLMFNFHCPPFGSGLDTAMKLTDDLRPVVERGAPVEAPVGSTAVREAIERYSPTVALHGHVHESAGTWKLGRTVCFNPGSDYSSGVLKGLLLELNADGSYRSHLLTTG